MSNNSEINMNTLEDEGASIFVIMYISIFAIVGTVGNSIVVTIYRDENSKSKWNSTKKYEFLMWVLAIADLIACSVIMPFTAIFYSIRFYLKFNIICWIFIYVTTSNIPFSALLFTLIALDRTVSIIWVDKSMAFTKNVLKRIILVLYAISATLAAVLTSKFSVYYTRETTKCCPSTNVSSLSEKKAEYNVTLLDDETTSCYQITIGMQQQNVNLTDCESTIEMYYNGYCGLKPMKSLDLVITTLHGSLFIFCFFISSVLYLIVYISVVKRNRAKRKRHFKTMKSLQKGLYGSIDFLSATGRKLAKTERVGEILRNISFGKLPLAKTDSRTTMTTEGIIPNNIELTEKKKLGTDKGTKERRNAMALKERIQRRRSFKTVLKSPLKMKKYFKRSTGTVAYVKKSNTIEQTLKTDTVTSQSYSSNMIITTTIMKSESSASFNSIGSRKMEENPDDTLNPLCDRKQIKMLRKKSKRNIYRQERRSNIRAATVLFAVAIIFGVCVLPAVLIQLGLIPGSDELFYCYFINNMSNPIVYFILHRHFREKLKRKILTAISANKFQSTNGNTTVLRRASQCLVENLSKKIQSKSNIKDVKRDLTLNESRRDQPSSSHTTRKTESTTDHTLPGIRVITSEQSLEKQYTTIFDAKYSSTEEKSTISMEADLVVEIVAKCDERSTDDEMHESERNKKKEEFQISHDVTSTESKNYEDIYSEEKSEKLVARKNTVTFENIEILPAQVNNFQKENEVNELKSLLGKVAINDVQTTLIQHNDENCNNNDERIITNHEADEEKRKNLLTETKRHHDSAKMSITDNDESIQICNAAINDIQSSDKSSSYSEANNHPKDNHTTISTPPLDENRNKITSPSIPLPSPDQIRRQEMLIKLLFDEGDSSSNSISNSNINNNEQKDKNSDSYGVHRNNKEDEVIKKLTLKSWDSFDEELYNDADLIITTI